MNKGIKLLIPLHHNKELDANEVRVLKQSHQPPLEAPVLGFVNINYRINIKKKDTKYLQNQEQNLHDE